MTLDYKLARSLKDAGFPQKDMFCFVYNLTVDKKNPSHEWRVDPDCEFNSRDEWVMAPTLSELIEAVCAKLHPGLDDMDPTYGFFSLAPNINTRTTGGGKEFGDIEEWRATVDWGKSLDEIERGENYFGPTPTEAVANLFLALNSDRVKHGKKEETK